MALRKLSGHEKAAIMLLTVGEEAAAEMFQYLDVAEIKSVSAFMNRFEEYSAVDVERVCNEYFVRLDDAILPPVPPQTKSRFLENVLARAVGQERGGELADGILSSPPGGALAKLQWHAPRTVANFISGEHPQVVAVILATMEEPGLPDKVLAELPREMQHDVVQRIAKLKTVPPERIREIEETLEEVMAPEERGPYGPDSGVHRVAEVLNTSPRAMEQAILSHIENRDPELADSIRDRMLRFEDFIQLDNPGLQKVLNLSTLQNLVLALRTASEELREHIYGNLTGRTSQLLEGALVEMGPTRVAEIEAAQNRLIALARNLLAKGDISLLGKPGDYIP